MNVRALLKTGEVFNVREVRKKLAHISSGPYREKCLSAHYFPPLKKGGNSAQAPFPTGGRLGSRAHARNLPTVTEVSIF
jgi:hypothetical protein